MNKVSTVFMGYKCLKLKNIINADLGSKLNGLPYGKLKFTISNFYPYLLLECIDDNLIFTNPTSYFYYMRNKGFFINSFNKKVISNLFYTYLNEVKKLKEG